MLNPSRRTRILLLLTALLMTSLSAPIAGQETGWGKFEGKVVAEWDGPRKMRLLQPFTFIDTRGKRWTAPRGTWIDGASIPWFLWSTVGSPFTGLYREASVVHDYYCDTMGEDWQAVHRMFYDAMRARGVGEIRAKLMFAAVYQFGPRWIKMQTLGFEESHTETIPITPEYDAHLAQETSNWVAENNPSVEDIEARIRAAEAAGPT